MIAELGRLLTCLGLGGPVGRAVAALPAEVLSHGLVVRRRRGAISRGRARHSRIFTTVSDSEGVWRIRVVVVEARGGVHFVMKGGNINKCAAISWDELGMLERDPSKNTCSVPRCARARSLSYYRFPVHVLHNMISSLFNTKAT